MSIHPEEKQRRSEVPCEFATYESDNPHLLAVEKVRFNAHESVLPLEKEKPTENKAFGS